MMTDPKIPSELISDCVSQVHHKVHHYPFCYAFKFWIHVSYCMGCLFILCLEKTFTSNFGFVLNEMC